MTWEKALAGLLGVVLAVCAFLATDKLSSIEDAIKKNNDDVAKLSDSISSLQSEFSENKGAIIGLNNSGADLRNTINQTFIIAQDNNNKLDDLMGTYESLQGQLAGLYELLKPGQIAVPASTGSAGTGTLQK